MPCKHDQLQLSPSQFAELAGYEQPDATTRKAAEASGKPLQNKTRSRAKFPGPLVLPHDDLNYDPDCPSQSFQTWLSEEERNMLTIPTRKILYIAQVPSITNDVAFMSEWTIPTDNQDSPVPRPDVDFFVEYLQAFYYSMSIKTLPTPLSWIPWKNPRQPDRQNRLPKHVGLAHAGECTRIRVRRPPDGIFPAQLDLNDITDALIALLPEDAYALLLLVDHDVYEGADDDFCCGRAFGGSRVAVVQTARYNPCLDEGAGIDRAHMWPMSHCKAFVDELCAVEDVVPISPTAQQMALSNRGPMRTAVDTALRYEIDSKAEDNAQALWFCRLARTVSHELGHCFGMDHCVYYACNMQGTAGMKEDVRQPPYLCPVCETKVGHAITVELQSGRHNNIGNWGGRRRQALMDFCMSLEERDMMSVMWKGLHGWLQDDDRKVM